MESKIINSGEITFAYPKLPALTREVAKFADGTVRIWSETWSRWVTLSPMIKRMETVKITWSN